mmetsp:Transcript_35587/g.113780  ORF Transcript_35587/g.113780 Transcript_35587/m.113780 type:complete len:228 (-) Transcript_35587:434-1117(-)
MSLSLEARWSARTARSLDRKRAMAAFLFMPCVRSRLALTTMPVGLWTMRTAVSSLLTFWPPAPPLRIVEISKSASGISLTSSFDEDSSSSSFSGMTGTGSTEAKDVCRFAWELKGLCRTRRWAPFSLRSKPKAPGGPPTLSVADFKQPGWSPGDDSKVSTLKRRRSPNRAYMRCSMPHQSWASEPPAPAWISKRQSHLSYGPLIVSSNSNTSKPCSSCCSDSSTTSR